MQLSIVIPAHNEEFVIAETVKSLDKCLNGEIPGKYDILIVADHCTDNTEGILEELSVQYDNVKWIRNNDSPGFGMAVRRGLNSFKGDAVVLFMADSSDSPEDVLCYYKKLNEGYDCVFGSRFIKEGHIKNYPKYKLVLNRITNSFIRLLFWYKYNDTTNAFKAYRKQVIEGCRPFLSPHFNLTVELPLKAVIRGYSYAVVPISWINRANRISNLKIKEMGSRYFFIIFYCFIEKWMTHKDYYKKKKEKN